MANIKEVFSHNQPDKATRDLLKEGKGSRVVTFGSMLSEGAREQLLALKQEGMRIHKTTNPNHVGVERFVRDHEGVYLGIYTFGHMMQTIPGIEESGKFFPADFVSNYNKGLSGIPTSKLNEPLIPGEQEQVPSDLLEKMRALKQKDPTYASHIIGEVLPDGLMRLLKRTGLALHYQEIRREGYAEWFQTYGKELIQQEGSSKKNKEEKKETSLKEGEERTVPSAKHQPSEKTGAPGATCTICRFETEADDQVVSLGLTECICLRCYGRETGTAKPMPKSLRRELQAALSNLDVA